MQSPLLVLSDTHISREYGVDVAESLALLLAQYPSCELILAGDIFDLSLDGAGVTEAASLQAALKPHERLVLALSTHVKNGQRVTIVPGNHDTGMNNPGQTEVLRRCLNAPDDRTVSIAPWFVRRGDVHIEHGHLYDPDCATNHPLTPPDPRSEGLGTALMRRFVAPHDAYFLAHNNRFTPGSAFRTAYEKWGIGAPMIVLDYFHTATALCLEALLRKQKIRDEIAQGNRLLTAHAAHTGLDVELVAKVLLTAPTPTHHGFRATCLRLYFDRVFAAASLAGGLSMLSAAGLGLGSGSSLGGLATVGLSGVGSLLTALGGGYLTLDTNKERDRYGNKVIGQLARAAEQVHRITGAQLVVFGHTHVEVDQPHYVNLGSFGYSPRPRPYLLIDPQGKPERMRAP